MNKKLLVEKASFLIWLLPILALSAVTTLDWGNLHSPVLFSDDWYLLQKQITGSIPLFDWAARRPLQDTIYAGVLSLAGLRLQYLVLLNFITTTGLGGMMYHLVRRAFPALARLALPVSLVYLVYPVDATRSWLVMLSIRVTALAALGIIYLFVGFASDGRPWKLILSLVGVTLSLMAYDGQFGLVMGAAAVIIVFGARVPRQRRILLLSVLAIGALYLLWRFVIQRYWVNLSDEYYSSLAVSPGILAMRLLIGVYVFVTGWAEALAPYLGLKTPLLFGLLWGCGMLGALIAFLVQGRQRDASGGLLVWGEKRKLLNALIVAFLLGLYFTAAGYIPVIGIFAPAPTGINSRTNLMAIAGASLVLVSLVAYIASIAARSIVQVRRAIWAALIPFLLLGITAQTWTHQENNAAWEVQKQAWNGLFKILPGIRENTTVVLVIPGYNVLRPLQRLPFSASYESTCGINILYHTTGLLAFFYYPDASFPQPVRMLESGVQERGYLPGAIPYADTLFVYFDPSSRSIRVIDRLEDYLTLPFQVKGYAPQNKISAFAAQSDLYRWLVK